MSEQVPHPPITNPPGPGLWVQHNGQWAWQPTSATAAGPGAGIGLGSAVTAISQLTAGKVAALAIAGVVTYFSGGQLGALVSGVDNIQTLVATQTRELGTLRSEVKSALERLSDLEARTKQLEEARARMGEQYGVILESYATMLKAWQTEESAAKER